MEKTVSVVRTTCFLYKRILSVMAVIFPLRHRLSFLLEKDNRSVHLVSQEGESFDIKVSVAKMSNLVKTMIDGACRLVSRAAAKHKLDCGGIQGRVLSRFYGIEEWWDGVWGCIGIN